jgi:glycerol-3-phosphate acyltransferase PlsY
VIKTYLIVAAVSYLLGSIPFGYILVKLFLKQDIRATGSGNIGATNVARSGAKGLAIATLALDAAKGMAAVFVARELVSFIHKPIVFCGSWSDFACNWPNSYTESFYLPIISAGGIAIFGHMFPVWLRFRGGKGVATAVGAFSVIAPHALLIALGVFLLSVAITHYVSLGSILASIVFPIAVWVDEMVLTQRPTGYGEFPAKALLILLVAPAAIVLKHHENIRRLLAGTENKFGVKKSVPPPDVMEKQA